MKFKKLHSSRLVNVDLSKYRVNWEGKCKSKFQFAVKQWLKPYWLGHCCCEELRVPGSRMTFDFVNVSLKIAIEVNGNQHSNFNKFFHNNSREAWRQQIKRDMDKEAWCDQNGFVLVEIFDKDLPLTKEFFKEKYNIDI